MSLQPAGGEFRVFPETLIGDQNLGLPAAAVLSDGSYVVVASAQGKDGAGYGVFGERFAATGSPIPTGTPPADEFHVNTTTAGDQTNAAVFSLADGFIVTWNSAGQDGSGSGVYAQIFDGSGAKIGSEFRVNTQTAGDQTNAVVDPLAGGGFAIAWASAGDIRAQVYGADGKPVNGELAIGSSGVVKEDPSIVALQTGGFLVTWTALSQDGKGGDVFGEFYDSVSQTLGNEFPLDTTTAGNQSQAHVTALPDGLLLATWIDHHTAVNAEFLTSAGDPVGAAVTVSTDPSTVKEHPTATAVPTAAGDYQIVVTWNSNNQDGSGGGVYGQILNSPLLGGDLSGNEFKVNSFTADDQRHAANSSDIVLADGTVIATWASNGEDTGGFGVYAQRFGTAASNAPPTIDDLNSALGGTLSELASTTGSSALDHTSGVIAFSDPNSADRPTASIAAQSVLYEDAQGDTLDLSAAQIAAIKNAFSLTPEAGNTNAGKLDWSYSIADDTLDFLGANEQLVLTSTIQIDDHHGGTLHRNVMVTIHGANDLPQASPDTDTSDATSAAAAAHNVLANDHDPDLHDQLHVTAVTFGNIERSIPSGGQVTIEGAFGSLTLSSDGSYKYAAHSTTAAADAVAQTAEDEDLGEIEGHRNTGGNNDDQGQKDVAKGDDQHKGSERDGDQDSKGDDCGKGPSSTGQDSFTYTVSDGNGGTTTSTLTITSSGHAVGDQQSFDQTLHDMFKGWTSDILPGKVASQFQRDDVHGSAADSDEKHPLASDACPSSAVAAAVAETPIHKGDQGIDHSSNPLHTFISGAWNSYHSDDLINV
jgi:VCBS repeat-containing protein